ncbi:MAG: hypothetical protein LBM75_00515 [Myxococcales bacterium]|jgi:hypothetical protein|nr:hypothetical protein [Myxococcales bacterium]
MRACCATCQHIFTVEGTGNQTCPNCGTQLRLNLPAVPAPAPSTEAPPESSNWAEYRGGQSVEAEQVPANAGDAPKPELKSEPDQLRTPWERRTELGFFKGLFSTFWQICRSPIDAFSKMPATDARGALSFSWIVGVMVMGVFGALLLTFLVLSDLSSLLLSGEASFSSDLWSLDSLILFLLCVAFIPLVQILVLLVETGLIHFAARLLGSNRNGFSATLRAWGYGTAPMNLLQLIPVLGLLAVVLRYAFGIIGFARLHRVSYGSAALACLTPPAVLCCGVGGLGALAAFVLPALSSSGVI